MITSKDRRLIWEYDDCKITPINCLHDAKAFGDGILRSRYWRIDFPDKSWVHCSTKKACRRYIDSCRERYHRYWRTAK